MLDRYKGIKKENVYKLKWYMDHFGLKEVVLCPISAKEKVIFTYIRLFLKMSGIQVKTSSINSLRKKYSMDNDVKNYAASEDKSSILFVSEGEGLKAVAQNGLNGLSTEDFARMFMLEKERLVPKTQVYNTLENCYSSLCIIGDCAFAGEMKEYYAGNKNIDVRLLGRDSVTFENGKYCINAAEGSDELVMIMDPMPQFPLFYGNSEHEANVFFANNMFRSFYKPVETYRRDIDNILKLLIDKGVTVVTVCSADYADFKGDQELVATIESWDKLRHKDSEAFNKKRHEARGTTHLLPNQRNLIHSYDKGFSQMYGNGEYINFLNGFRVTSGNKVGAHNDIYMFGACVVRDLGADDDHTLASLIKKEIGSEYNVQNYGSEIHATNLIMRTLDYKPGDVIIWWSLDNIKKIKHKIPGVHYCDLTPAYKRVPELHKHIFDDINHYDMTVKNEVVKEIAAAVRSAVCADRSASEDRQSKAGVISFGPEHKRIPGKELLTDPQLLKCLDDMAVNKVESPGKKGAIVMNCNPFTLGHRYLIETAAGMVDHLYVFVVEEDKSIFKFSDRLEMVKQGTADLSNVSVLPSGKFILSSQTLPGYFTKAEFKDAILNASDDLEFFMQIASALDITVRFVGEEPIDQYTRQYNDSMRNTLPKYGFEFIEIPRKTVASGSDVVISASRVRKLLEEGNYAGVKEIVPETTYMYLKDKLNLIKE